MWSDWLVFCDCGFHFVCPLTEKDKRLMEASWWKRLTEGETGSCSDVLMGGAMLSKSLIQFSVDGCVPSLLFDLRPNCGGGNEGNGDLLQKVPCMHCYTQCLQPAEGHRPPTPPLDTPGHSQASLGQSLLGSLGSWYTLDLFVPPRSLFPQSCFKFWQLSGGVNGDLLQEGLCHSQV